MNKRLAALGVGASVLMGAAGFTLVQAGTAGAQTGTPPTATAPSKPKPDPDTRHREALKPLLENKTLTQDQLDAVIKALHNARPTGGKFDPKGKADLTTVAGAIGITVDELRTALKTGQSIAEVATAKGVDPQKVIDAVVAKAQKALADQVTAGKLTQAQSDARLEQTKKALADAINRKPAFHAGPGFGGRGPGRPGGR